MTPYITEYGSFLAIFIERISVPSIQALFFKTIPTPVPSIPPPKTADNNKSWVITGM
jgi:hypothetical protein